jgi:hypothetical protein
MTSRRWLVWSRKHQVYSTFDTRTAANEFAERLRRRHPDAAFPVLAVRQVVSATEARAARGES